MNWTTFLLNKNGSNFFYELLTPLATHTEGPSDFTKIVITLAYINGQKVSFYDYYNSPKLTLCTVCRNFRSQYCCSSPVTSVNRTAGYNQWANKQSFDLICCPMWPPQKLTKSHKHSHEARSTTVRPVIC